jgi:hypothetical protein
MRESRGRRNKKRKILTGCISKFKLLIAKVLETQIYMLEYNLIILEHVGGNMD